MVSAQPLCLSGAVNDTQSITSAGCNVGYAFVNFITVEDLLHFATTMLGVKWNMYASEKTLQLGYATYQ